jgi:integrase
MSINWTDAWLGSIALPPGTPCLRLSDPKTPGLIFEIRRAARSFYLCHLVAGRPEEVLIGAFPAVSYEDARAQVAKGPEGETRPGRRGHGSVGVPTLADFFETVYLPYSRIQHRDRLGNRSLFRNHLGPGFGALPMGQITKLGIRSWVRQRLEAGYAPATINRCLVLLGHMFSLANDLDVEGVPERTRLRIKLLRVVQKHTTHLSAAEVQRLARALDCSRNRALPYIIRFMLMTGARRSETLNARWDEIDMERRIWVVPLSKSGQPRPVYLSEAAHGVLLEIRRAPGFDPAGPFLFANPRTGRPYRCVFHSWKKVRDQAGLPHLRLHDLRHSFASTLVNNGVSLYDVQKLLGHASIKTTQRYAHLSADRLLQSASVAAQSYGPALGLRDRG